MTKPDSFNPFLMDPEFLQVDVPAKNIFQTPTVTKPGPVRALRLSDAHWAKLEAIKPYPESPIHE